MSMLKIQSTDTVSKDRIKADVQRAYLQEVIPYHNWPWLRSKINLKLDAYTYSGTASVTSNSVSVTLTEAPTHSKAGYNFSIDGSTEIYKIITHAGGGTAVTLDMPFMGTSNSTARYKIWTDSIPLPSDCQEIIEITHPFALKPMEGMGIQEIRRVAALGPKTEGRPRYYTLGNQVDPSPYSAISGSPTTTYRSSSGTLKTIVFASTLGASTSTLLLKVGDRIRVRGAGSYDYNIDAVVASVTTTTLTNDTITYSALTSRTESSTADTGITVTKQNTESYEVQNQLIVFPSMFNQNTLLAVDYIKDIQALESDDDEPSIPLKDRVILYWLGASYAYSRERNPEEAMLYRQLGEQRLAKMAGRTTESVDKPSMVPSNLYLNSKRQNIRSRFSRAGADAFSGVGSGGQANITGTANKAAIYDSDGQLASSPSISTTELGYLDGVTSNLQTQLDAITTLADGKIYIGNAANSATEVTPSGDVTMTNAGVTSITAGVIVDADINASAAITRSKTASGTAYRILANNSSGVMSENAALTASAVVVADANGQLASSTMLAGVLTSATLADNTAVAADVATWTAATYDTIILRYSLKRGSANKATGQIKISTDGTNAAIAQDQADIGTLGVTFTVDVSAGSLRLRYTTTSTGTAVTMKYLEEKWLA